MFQCLRRCLSLALAWAALPVMAGTLWISDGETIYRIDTTVGRVQTVAAGLTVQAVAPKADGGAWVASDRALLSFDASGTLRRSTDLAELALPAAPFLAVDAHDATLWAASERRLAHLSAEGESLASIVLPVAARAVGVAQDESVWVLVDSKVLHFSPRGEALEPVALPAPLDPGVARLAVDSLGGMLWVAAGSKVMRIDLASPADSTLSTLREPARDLVLEARSGMAFALSGQAVIVHDERGMAKKTHDLAGTLVREARALAWDHVDGALWVAGVSGVVRLLPEDAPYPVLALPRVESAASAPFWITPRLRLLEPAPGAILSNSRPAFKFGVDGLCSGVPCGLPASYGDSFMLHLSIDGREATHETAATGSGEVTLTPPEPLAGGTHVFSAAAVDDFGHMSNRIEGGFTIATAISKATNKAPAVTMTSPANNAAFNAGATITLAANASDSDGTVAKVEFFRGGTISLGVVTTAPYTLPWTNPPAGSFSLTAKATDNAGASTTSTAVNITVVPNSLPTVSITSPASGTVYPAPGNVTLTASASDSDGTIAKVEFFQGTTLIGTVAGPPYIVQWNSVAKGTYSVTAKATDNAGGASTSTAVTVIVASAPLVVLKQPANCSTFDTPANLTLAADAADLNQGGFITKVEFLEGSTIVGTATRAPYGVNWLNVAVGTHTLTARATNNFGLVVVSAPIGITVSVPNNPPTVSITSPAPGATFRVGNTVTVAASASDSDGTVVSVTFYQNGSRIGSSQGPVFSVPWSLTQAVGVSLTADAVDDKGASTTSGAVIVTVNPNALPSVSLTAPVAGSAYRAPATVSFAATASDSDGTVAKVEFLLDEVVAATSTTSPYAASKSGVAAGTHTVAARAIDNDGGRSSTANVSITVAANALPSVSITAPANGATFNAPANVTLTASASDSDGSIARVEFFADGVSIGAITTGPYTVTWQNPGVGSHTIRAIATDNDGAPNTSASVSITVNGITAAITAPPNGASYVAPAAFDLKTTASTSSGNITSVEFYDGTALLQTIPVGSGFSTANVTLSLSAVAAGTHAYSVKAYDNGGRIGTSPAVTVTVAPPPIPPAVTLTAPSANAYYIAPATVKLSASATAGSSPIAKVEFYAGSTLIATATSAPYNFRWTNVAAGSYSLTAKATDTAGGTMTSTAVAITAGTLSIAIDSPTNGAGLTGDSVLVSGTVQASQNSGITVNGQVAAVDASGHFYLNLPLAAGSNTLTATVTTAAGQTATQTATVSIDGIAPLVRINASPLQGVAPLTVTAALTNGAATDVTVRVNGNVSGTLPARQSVSFNITYDGAGTFPLAITATDAQNNVTTGNFVVVAADASQMDQMLKAIWGGMIEALASADKATALSFLSLSAQARYGPVFDALAADLPTILPTWSQPLKGALSISVGEYAIVTPNAGARALFLIYFVRGSDGVWRLDSM